MITIFRPGSATAILLILLSSTGLSRLHAHDDEFGDFVRGDVNLDHSVDLGDAMHLIFYLFTDRVTTLSRRDAADINDDGMLDLTDVVRLLEFLYLRGAPPAAPFPAAGKDPTADRLDEAVTFSPVIPFVGAPMVRAPVIDGVLGRSEWLDARVTRVPIGRVAEGELYVKTSPTDVYLAFVVSGDRYKPGTVIPKSLSIFFGLRPGADAFQVTTGRGTLFRDLTSSERTREPLPGLPEFGSWVEDESVGGTADGEARASIVDGQLIFEARKSLVGGDGNDLIIGGFGQDLMTPVGEIADLFLQFTDPEADALALWPAAAADGVYARLPIQSDIDSARLAALGTFLQDDVNFGIFQVRDLDRGEAQERKSQVVSEFTQMMELLNSGELQEAKVIADDLRLRLDPLRPESWVQVEQAISFTLFDFFDQVYGVIFNGLILDECSARGPYLPGIRDGKFYFFEEDFESADVPSGWSRSGLWRHVTSGDISSHADHDEVSANVDGGMRCFWFADESTGNYENEDERVHGNLISPSFFVPHHDVIVAFDTWEQTEDRLVYYDRKEVYYRIGGGAWRGPIYRGQRRTWSGGPNNWTRILAQLPPETQGECVQLRFSFDSVDGTLNIYGGWMIDNVAVYATAADTNWTAVGAPQGANPSVVSSASPVLVGDERNGQLFAATVGNDDQAYLSAHDMHSSWGPWIGIVSPVPLAEGSIVATSYEGPDSYPRTHGTILLVARGRDDSQLYYLTFRPDQIGFFPLALPVAPGRSDLGNSRGRLRRPALPRGDDADRARHRGGRHDAGPGSLAEFISRWGLESLRPGSQGTAPGAPLADGGLPG